MLPTEKRLYALEVLVAATIAAAAVAVVAAVVWVVLVVPGWVTVLLLAFPAGMAARWAPMAPSVPDRVRGWHQVTLSRWLTADMNRRWGTEGTEVERWKGQEEG